jgi:hypothetical protein
VEPPIGLTPAYWENPSRSAQVRAFARRVGLTFAGDPAAELELFAGFLLPVIEDARSGLRRKGTWRPAGPWQEAAP